MNEAGIQDAFVGIIAFTRQKDALKKSDFSTQIRIMT